MSTTTVRTRFEWLPNSIWEVLPWLVPTWNLIKKFRPPQRSPLEKPTATEVLEVKSEWKLPALPPVPSVPLSRLSNPQRISHYDYIRLMDGAPTRDIVGSDVTHAITPCDAVIEVSDTEPPEWIGNLAK
ncbi:MAG: hypothetical protein F4139_04815 [Gemmatimonadetes bacterium]|nr:hypothetical protein [Gemmatimonadota bacterium]MYB98915.1 hypothetical protein [Gemmatimonadota bacterium]MYH52257.1 hypothetical protein [Gemmatimonadota bacterium]